MKTDPISVDGVAGPVEVTTNAFWGRPVVTVAGQPAPYIGKRQYSLPGADGSAVRVTLRSGFADPYPTVEVNGRQYRTGPQVPVGLRVLTLLPILMVGIGGALGGLIGALAVVANLSAARTQNSSAVKALIMIGVAVIAVLVYFVIASAVLTAVHQG